MTGTDEGGTTQVGTANGTRDSSGFTLVELLMAITVIVVTMVPMTSIFWSGLRASANSSHRTDAFSIASREVEGLHANPYASIGFYADQAAPAWKTATTVVIGACSTTCPTPFAPLILPTGSSTPVPGNTGITYSIARYLYWADAQGVNTLSASTTFPQAYKGATIVVTWNDQSGSHIVQQDSIIYPGGQGVYAGPGGSMSTSTTSAPSLPPGSPSLAVAVNLPVPPLNQQEIDLIIAPPVVGGPVAGYYAQWSTDPLFVAPPPAQSPQLPPTSISYAIQGLSAGTAYSVRVFAFNGAGQSGYSPVVAASTSVIPVTTTVPAVTTTLPSVTSTLPVVTTTTVPATTTTTTPPCVLGSFSVTTALTGKTYLAKTSGLMTESVVLSLNVNGTCVAVTAMSVLHGTSTNDPNSPYVLTGPAVGGQWSATIFSLNQAGWTVGIHDITISVGGNVTAVTHGLLICAWKAPGQRNASSNVC